MFLDRTLQHFRIRQGLMALGVLLMGMAASSHALVRTCDAPPTTAAAINACVKAYGTPVNSKLEDTLKITLTKSLKITDGQVLIDSVKNVFLIGDTVAMPTEGTLPTIIYQDQIHINSDTTNIGKKAIYWEYNGALVVNQSRKILILGVAVNGAALDSGAAAGKIFAFCGTYSTKGNVCVDVKGNIGVNIRNSYGVTFRGGSVTNSWYGIAIQGRNLGGAFSYPTPLDPPSQVNATLPTSRSGLYGRHMIEQSRFHDNTWGTLFEYDWDLGSVVRNNLYYENFLRNYGEYPDYVTGLLEADNRKNTLGTPKNLRYNVVGGAFFMNGVALTPYRINNNTFYHNGVTVGSYYMAGTQHLFYNNLIGAPHKYYNAAQVPAEMTTGGSDNDVYTQTERATEMLQFYSEHQRSNLVVPQDGQPTGQTGPIDLYGNIANFRLFRMKMNRRWTTPPTATDWRGDQKAWNNQASDLDSLSMSWVPEVTTTPINQFVATARPTADAGLVQYIRHNMYAGTIADPYDKDANTSAYGLPYMPLNIQKNLLDPKVFRDVSGFNIRWAASIPFASLSAGTSFLKPVSTAKSIVGQGWPTYDGQAAKPLDIGALSSVSTANWAVPDARLVLQDTLIEMMQGDTIGFRMDVSSTGFSSADIMSLKVAKAKFYYDVPVADTTFNAGGCTTRNLTTGKCTVGNDTTRINSILSSKPWPIADSVINYNLWHVDDTLTAGKLRPDHFFIGKLSKGALPDSVYHARAEVVLVATLADGRIVYSNPGVFMYSRPRFLLDVVLKTENGQDLPIDADGYSRQVLAGQKVIMSVTPRFDTKDLPTTVSRFRDLQMGQTTLMGSDTANSSLERDSTGLSTWQKIHPNQILQPTLGKTETAIDTLRFTEAGLVGSMTLRALFDVQDQRFLQGISKRVRVVASSIYQATIDSVYFGGTLVVAPKPTLKRAFDLLAGGAGLRDTLLKTMVGTRLDSTLNISHMGNGMNGKIRLVLQVRDAFGNPVTDSAAAGLLVKLQGASNGTRFDNGLGALPVDVPGVVIPGTGIRAFDKNGRVVFDSISISSPRIAGLIFPLRSSVVLNTAGNPEIGAGTPRPGIPDTTWIQAAPGVFGLQIVDTTGAARTAVTGIVGDLIPIRLKALSKGAGTKVTSILTLTGDPALKFFSGPDGLTAISSIAVADDSLSPIVWVKAVDTTSSGTYRGGVTIDGEPVTAIVSGNVFSFPRLRLASFFDEDCDGRVDSISLRFLDPVKFRGGTASLKDSIDVLFPGQFLSPSALGAAPRTTLINDTILTLAWDPATMSAASPAANRIILGSSLGGASMTLRPLEIEDRAPPLALSGVVQQSYRGAVWVDVVTVKFSEPIDTLQHAKGAMFPFNVKRGSSIVKLDTMATGEAIAQVGPGQYRWTLYGRLGAIMPGDSLIVSGAKIRDLAGNTTDLLCKNKPFPTTILSSAAPSDVIVLDLDGDGNGDHLKVSYKDSIGTLPASFTVRWGTPVETLTVTAAMIPASVKTSDTSFTVAFTGWVGQNVTVDGDVVKAPRTVGPEDVAAFFGGAVTVRVRDGIPPVLIHAKLFYDQRASQSKVDTLRLTFSEPIGGCPAGTSPASCLDLKRPPASALKFPAGSSVIDVSGAVMRIAVPADGPDAIVAGDSVRALPSSNGGAMTDVPAIDGSANKVGDKSPWVVVRADRRPPRMGWFIDENGDGIVEAVVVEYAQPSADTSLPNFTFTWGDASGQPAISTAASWSPLDAAHRSWKVVLASPFQKGVTGYPPASSANLGSQISQTTYSFPVRDSVGPVLLPGARLNPAAGSNPADTILAQVSEPVADPTGNVLLAFRHGNHVIPTDSVKILSVLRLGDGNWRVVIDPNSPWHPAPGDSIRLSISGSVKDTTQIGMTPNPKHAWVNLVGRPRAPYDASYLDANADGRIDTWTADFAVPPTVGTVIRVRDPAGSDSVQLYVVTPADSNRTHFQVAITPWGANVTSLVTPDLGRLYLPGAGAKDTAPFPIRDAVEPVIVDAYMGYTSDIKSVDTLRVHFSENVSVDPSQIVLAWKLTNGKGDSANIKPVSAVWDSASRTLTFLLNPVPETKGDRPEKGDLVRIFNNGAVKDQYGNTPKPVAKWTPIIGTRRIFPPAIGLTNPMINLDPSKPPSGGKGFQFVWRKPTTSDPETQLWTGENLPGFDPAVSGSGAYGSGSSGTVLFLSTNVPTKLNLYVYDILGTYTASSEVNVTQELINQLNSEANPDTARNTMNQVDVGFMWNGLTFSGTPAATGIYVVRIVAFRQPTPEEKATGVTGVNVTNYLRKIGVKSNKH